MRPDELRFIEHLQQLSIQILTEQSLLLFAYLQKLLSANQTTNLTAIDNYTEALTKHLLDSLLITNQPIFQNAQRILDVGSGAGLPGIPLAICFPDKVFISIEATRKKINFQQQTCKELGIKNHHAIWGRSEELAHDPNHRENYDLVLARALAATDSLAELTLPFVTLNHYAIFFKAKDYLNELQNAKSALKLLGGSVSDVITIKLPDNHGVRNLLLIKKTNTTPNNYPRRPGLPQKSPIK
jgi:16S rRNA (guanine527-N7)-methyltransferase